MLKWILAVPHYIVLALLFVGALLAVIIAWFAILITGNSGPRLEPVALPSKDDQRAAR